MTPATIMDAFGPGARWVWPPTLVAAVAATPITPDTTRWDADRRTARILDAAEATGLLALVVAGERTGHVLAPCAECGAPIMRRRSAGPVGCRMTPGCKGRHVRA